MTGQTRSTTSFLDINKEWFVDSVSATIDKMSHRIACLTKELQEANHTITK